MSDLDSKGQAGANHGLPTNLMAAAIVLIIGAVAAQFGLEGPQKDYMMAVSLVAGIGFFFVLRTAWWQTKLRPRVARACDVSRAWLSSSGRALRSYWLWFSCIALLAGMALRRQLVKHCIGTSVSRVVTSTEWLNESWLSEEQEAMPK